MIGWEAVLSALLAIIITLCSALLAKLAKIEDKLDQKLSRTECKDQIDRCDTRFDAGREESRELWLALSTHSHEGLPSGAKVTR